MLTVLMLFWLGPFVALLSFHVFNQLYFDGDRRNDVTWFIVGLSILPPAGIVLLGFYVYAIVLEWYLLRD